MFRILFTLVPVLSFGVIGFSLLNSRWKIEYGYYDLSDLTRDDWITVGLLFLGLIMLGVLFNLIAITFGGL